MGCGGSRSWAKVFLMDDAVPGQGKDAKELFDMLGLKEEDINVLYGCFCSIAIKGQPTVCSDRILLHCQVENSKLTREVLKGFDMDGDDNINFKEFVVNMWYFIVKDLQAVAELTFDIYDTDGSGELTKKEIYAMLEEVYGRDGLDKTVKLFIEDMDGRDQNKKISRREFASNCTDYPQLIFPAMEIQTHLIKYIGGEKFWRRLIDESKKILIRQEVIAYYDGVRKAKLKNAQNGGPKKVVAKPTKKPRYA